MTFTKSITNYSRLFRIPNLLILALGQFLVRFGIIQPLLASRGIHPQMPLLDFILFVCSTLLIAAAGYVINDYFDVTIDEVNRPEKMIVGKLIPLKRAVALHYALTIPGCLIGIYISYQAGSLKLGFIHIIIAIVLWYYSRKYKRIPIAGNITIALLTALSMILVWMYEFFYIKQEPYIFPELIGYFSTINIMVFSYAIFAFMLSLIREMIKDIEDIEGDRAFGCRTLPIVYGIKPVWRTLLILSILAIAMTAFAAYKLFEWDCTIAAWYFCVVMGGLWLYYILQFVKAKEKKDYHFVSTVLKIIMLAGVLSMQLVYIRI